MGHGVLLPWFRRLSCLLMLQGAMCPYPVTFQVTSGDADVSPAWQKEDGTLSEDNKLRGIVGRMTVLMLTKAPSQGCQLLTDCVSHVHVQAHDALATKHIWEDKHCSFSIYTYILYCYPKLDVNSLYMLIQGWVHGDHHAWGFRSLFWIHWFPWPAWHPALPGSHQAVHRSWMSFTSQTVRYELLKLSSYC